jgi:hypothetical protein
MTTRVEHFAAERYAERFLAFVDTPFAPAPSFSPPTRSARSSGGWAATPDTPITNTVAAVSHELFAEVPEPSPQAR